MATRLNIFFWQVSTSVLSTLVLCHSQSNSPNDSGVAFIGEEEGLLPAHKTWSSTGFDHSYDEEQEGSGYDVTLDVADDIPTRLWNISAADNTRKGEGSNNFSGFIIVIVLLSLALGAVFLLLMLVFKKLQNAREQINALTRMPLKGSRMYEDEDGSVIMNWTDDDLT